MDLEPLILQACAGDLTAYGQLVAATQKMVHAVCFRVLNDHALALDAAQETYLRVFPRLADLREPAAFPGWLRRIAINTARNLHRKRHLSFLHTADLPDIPILDQQETTWTESQQQSLARALLQLSPEDRRLCDRFYHGGWTTAHLATDAGITEPAMRKRLQRIRDQLREDAEMNEQQAAGIRLPPNLPDTIVELLSPPKLIDLPENPVGRMTDLLKPRYADYRLVDIPETVEVHEAQQVIGPDPHHLPSEFIHYLNPNQFLRYDTTLPLLIASKNIGSPARRAAAGQVYRNQSPTPMRDQSFHQFELLLLDDTARLDPWNFMGEILHILADLLPGRTTTIEPIDFPSCKKAWEIGITSEDRNICILSWGIYTDHVLKYLGADPARHTAFGLGYGLERMAALHFGYDDIRTLAAARV